MNPEKRSPRRGRCKPAPASRETSSDLALDERYLEHLLMQDGTVSEKAALAEQFSVIGRHRDVGILGDLVEKLFHHAIQILHGPHLAIAQHIHLGLLEEAVLALHQQFAPDYLIVQM